MEPYTISSRVDAARTGDELLHVDLELPLALGLLLPQADQLRGGRHPTAVDLRDGV